MVKKDLSITFMGVKFPNPFCLSSSPVGNCYDMCAKAYREGWGGVVFKTIGPKHYLIDEVSPRFDALTKEAEPFVGFKNMEQIAEHSLEENLEDLRKLKQNYPDHVLIASIMGSNEEDWEELARLVTEAGADMIELNFSCPQMTSHAMGSDVGSSPELCKKYCEAVRRGTSLPFMAKMTPNITDMCIPAIASMEGGANGISAINTIKSIINVDLDKKVGLPIINGKSSISGYSGKAVKPIALRFIQQMKSNPKLKDTELSGIGGIETWEDAAEFILLGCKNLQMTTSIMQYGYRIVEDLCDGLSHYMEKEGVDHLEDLVGLANKNIIPAEELDRDYKVYPSIDLDKCIGCGRCVISCFDGAHQAMEWNKEERRPNCNTDKCVGCLLCALVCPIGAINAGERVLKEGRKPKNLNKIILQDSFQKL
jgi:dihydropyrimidine dehydrogenase (NAD+) subunit PreA